MRSTISPGCCLIVYVRDVLVRARGGVQGKHDEDKALYERAIQIGEKTFGSEHPDFDVWLNNLAGFLSAQVSDIYW